MTRRVPGKTQGTDGLLTRVARLRMRSSIPVSATLRTHKRHWLRARRLGTRMEATVW